MAVCLAILHPQIVEEHRLAILFLIGKRDGLDGIAQTEGSALQFFVAGDDGIAHEGVVARRAHLHINRFAISRELLA